VTLRTDLADSFDQQGVHADQHNQVNAAVLTLQGAPPVGLQLQGDGSAYAANRPLPLNAAQTINFSPPFQPSVSWLDANGRIIHPGLYALRTQFFAASGSVAPSQSGLKLFVMAGYTIEVRIYNVDDLFSPVTNSGSWRPSMVEVFPITTAALNQYGGAFQPVTYTTMQTYDATGVLRTSQLLLRYAA
jgi:hypothetical protein